MNEAVPRCYKLQRDVQDHKKLSGKLTDLATCRLHRPDVARVAQCIGTPTWDAATVRRKLLPLLIEWDAQV